MFGKSEIVADCYSEEFIVSDVFYLVTANL